MSKLSITDKPRIASENDSFGIEPFENGLKKFIENSNTPITIALQGEWGSGKTSLMNSLEDSLGNSEKKTDSKFHSIWLNTWEYSLMKDASATLIDIIIKLIEKVAEIAKINNSVKEQNLIKGIKRIAFTALKVASSVNGIANAAMDEVEKYNKEQEVTISQIRKELEEIIAICIKEDKKEGFIFFIDDLDRIDPPVAVQLLELLKNIFTLDNCVFVLAIDYDVVIKGLEPKFGKLSDKNEREFRSFFDKIIQVPFSMPVSSYKADKFLKPSLLAINYLKKEQADNQNLIVKFSEISDLSVGKNPRALKRLMNSLSLISCINSTKEQTEEDNQLNSELELLTNFALVSIQIAYPPVYRLLSLHPNFEKWDENVALQMSLKALDNHSIEKLNAIEEFDEEWEQVLFRLCENDHYLKKRALSISRLLNNIKTSIEEKDENVEDIISSVISLSSVTNIEAFDKPVIDYHKGNFLKIIRDKMFSVLKEKLPESKDYIKQVGSRVQINFNFSVFSNDRFRMKSFPKDGGVNLRINTAVEYGQNIKDFEKDLKQEGLFADFELIANEYDDYFQTNSKFTTEDLFKLGIWRHKKIDHCFINLTSHLLLPSPSDFYTDESIEIICNQIIKINEFKIRVQKLANRRNKKD